MRKTRLTRKAVFCILAAIFLISFLCGTLMMVISSFSSEVAGAIGAVRSLYYYLLGFMIVLVSAILFILTVVVFLLIRLFSFIKKKHAKN